MGNEVTRLIPRLLQIDIMGAKNIIYTKVTIYIELNRRYFFMTEAVIYQIAIILSHRFVLGF